MRKEILYFILFFTPLSILHAQLSGDYYIPQGSNPQGFPSLAAACSTLNADGASGTVRFLIDDNLSETATDLRIYRSDLNSTNNLIIKPAPGKTPTITISGCGTTGEVAYSGFTIDSTGFVTIDGSNTSGGTSRDLTFLMNDGTNGRIVINLYENTDNILIKNIKILYATNPASSTSSRGIYANGLSDGVADTVIIENCQIGDGIYNPNYAVSISGYSTGSVYASNIYIRNNLLYGRLRAVYFFYVGTSTTQSEISGNTIITNIAPPSGNVVWGILFNNYGGTINIFNNKLNTLYSASSGTEGVYAFGTLNGQTGVTINLYNNFFGGDINHTGTGTPSAIDVISFQDAPTSSTCNVYNNTVILNNMTKTASSRMTAIRLAGNWTKNLKNNIFINNKTGTSIAYCILMGATTGTMSFNNNVYYLNDNTNGNVGYWTSANKTLADWQGASSQDANSKFKAVNFVSSTDLHLTGSSIGDNDLIGEVLGSPYNTDIDGDPRDAYFPYKGADENTTKKLPSAFWTPSMSDAYSNIQAFGNGSKIGSDGTGIDFYANWDNTYLYLGWSGGNTIYSSDMYYAAIDTDPSGSSGTTNSIEGVDFLNATGGQRPDYYVVYENNASYYGSPVSNGNAFEVYGVTGGAWSWISRTSGDDGTSSQIVFSGTGGEVRLRVPWSSLGGFTPGTGAGLGIVMWNNNSNGNYMWARYPTSNPATGSTPKTLTNYVLFTNTGSGVNPASDQQDKVWPVELVRFSARVTSNSVYLSWRTETEINSFGFEVERKNMGGKWEKIGFVQGAGNSNSPKEYVFVDDKVLPGKYAYRLKQIDNDGSFKFSDEIEIVVGNFPTEYEIRNYPNPFNPTTTIQFSIVKPGNYKINLYSTTGEKVREIVNEYYEAGVYRVMFNSTGLASGVYISILEGEGVFVKNKMVILK